jgi:hypothetical protein
VTPVEFQTESECASRADVLLAQFLTDQRSRFRFPIVLALSYRTLERKTHSGTGRTVNISSTGLLAECSDPFIAGITVKLTMQWPARLHGMIPLHLVMIGSIVRCETSRFAVAASQLRLVPGRLSLVPDLPMRISQKQTEQPAISIAANSSRPVQTVKTFRNTPETEQRIAMLLPCRPDRIQTETGPAGPRRIP